MTASAWLHVIGYPVAIAGILRLRRTFRERRTWWFLLEEAGTAAIVVGWLLAGGGPRTRRASAVNGLWGVALAVAWVVAGRRRKQ